MLRSCAIAISLFCCLSAAAQTAVVTGSVLDKVNRRGVSGASVVLFQSARQDANARHTITDTAGRYSFDGLAKGKYLIITSCVGYRNDSTHVDLIRTTGSGYTLDIGLVQQGSTLGAAEVVTKKPTIVFDRGKLIFDVKQTSFTTGSNAWDLLPKSPGVETQGTAISILGKEGAGILINGRPTYLTGDQLVSFLKGISGDQIDYIEVIQHPGVKYDLGQGSGIINIVLKKNQAEGFNGSATTAYTQGAYNGYSGSTNFNYRKSKVNLYGSFSYSHRINYIDQPAFIDYTQSPVEPSYFSEDQQSKIRTHNFNFTGGVDYNIDKKSSLGLFYNGAVTRSNTAYYNETRIQSQKGALDSSITTTSNVLAPTNLNLFNFYYTLRPDSLSTITLNADYGHYHNSNSQHYQYAFDAPEGPYTEANYDSVPGTIEIKALSLDYTRKLGKSVDLQAGLKSSLVDLNDDFTSNMPLQDETFHYRERINAGYLSFDKRLRKGDLQLGLRLEHTDITRSVSTGAAQDSAYWKVLPSVTLNQDLSANSSLSLSYSTSFERPSYSFLTPFAIQRDPYSYSAGNPFLSPSYQNSFELDYILFKKYTVAAEFDDIENRMEQWVLQNDTTKQLANIITNIRNNYYYRIYFILPVTIRKWWTSNNTINNYIIQYKTPYLGSEYNKSRFVFYWSSLNSFIINPTTSIDLFLYYRTPSLNGLYQIGTRKFADVSFRKSLWHKRASLVLTVGDIFHSNKWIYTIDYRDQHSGYTYISDSRYARLSFTYKFGRTTIKAPKKVQTGIGDEKGRL